MDHHAKSPGSRSHQCLPFISTVIVAAAFFITSASAFAQQIATDKTSYQPGETVLVSGEGWQPQEVVTLRLGNVSGTRYVAETDVTVTADGTFTDKSFVVQDSDRDDMLIVNARSESGAVAMIAFKDGVAPGSLSCSSLKGSDGEHYGIAPWQKVTCTIEGATDLSAAQQAGAEPVEVLVRSDVLGNQPATVTSVKGTTITFEYTAPENGCESAVVSYGPIKTCDSSTGRCMTFPTWGNDASSSILSGGDSPAGFAYVGPAGKLACGGSMLNVDVSPRNGTFTQGSHISYKILVTNPQARGGASATNVKLADQLPGSGGLVWQNVSTSQGTCVNPVVNNTLDCNLGTIDPQQSVTVTVTSSDSTPAAACRHQPNVKAAAAGDGGFAGFGSGALSCTPPPQIKVVTTPDNGTFQQGLAAIFYVTVSNTAPANSDSGSLTHVRVTSSLPTNGGLHWGFAGSTAGPCTVYSDYLSCRLSDIAPGNSTTVTVYSTAATPNEACQYQSYTATATADGGLTADDSGSVNCTPKISSQLKVAVTPDSYLFQQGAAVTYTIMVSNPSSVGTTTNIQLTDVLPTEGGLTWTSANPSQGACSITNNTLNCGLGTLQPGKAATVVVSTPATTPPDACTAQPNLAAIATADGGFTARDSGFQRCIGAQLRVNKYPHKGWFQQGGQVSFSIVVRNPADIVSSLASAALGVHLTDQLPGNGGLTWTSVTTTQGKCSLLKNNLDCQLGDIPPGGTVTVNVASPSSTPVAACQLQASTAVAIAAGVGVYAESPASLNCYVPCTIPAMTTSWNSFKIPAGTSPRVWVHAHTGKVAGIPATGKTKMLFTRVSIVLNENTYLLPDGLVTFDDSAPATISTQFNKQLNRWETLVNPNSMSEEMFFSGGIIDATIPHVSDDAKAVISYNLQSDVPVSFPWQWSAAVYTFWPDDLNQALIQPYHSNYHAGAPLNQKVQDSLIQGPRGGAGSNFTGSWSATGDGVCSGQGIPEPGPQD